MTDQSKATATEWARWGFSQLVVPLLVAAFTLGGAWAAFGNVTDDVDDLVGKHGQDEQEGHPLIMLQVNAHQRQLDLLRHNVGQLCLAADGADCRF